MTLLPITPAPEALWKEVRNTTAFPILAETRERIRQQMQKARISFDELAPSIESDPALCMNLLMLAAKQHPGCVEQISGAANCLSLLGMQELVKLIKHLDVIEAHPPEPAKLAYRRAVMCSRFAGNLAAEWSAVKGNVSVNYARWSTMLTMAPLWSWLLHWPQAANWLYLVSRGEDLNKATRTLFGKDEKHWLLVLRHIHLPQMAQQVYCSDKLPNSEQWRLLRREDPRDLDNQRALIHICQSPAMTSLMANQLAWQLHMAPDGVKARRWLVLASHWLGKPVHQVGPKVRHIQLQTSLQQQSTLGTGLHLYLSPQAEAEPYPWIAADGSTVHNDAAEQQAATRHDPDTASNTNNTNTNTNTNDSATTNNNTASDTDTKAAVTAAADEHRHADEAYMKKLLYQLHQEPDSFGDWHFLMKSMLKGVTDGLGLPSACIALLNKEKTVLKVFYAEGLSPEAPMRRFAVGLRNPNLFTKLLEKPAGLLLTSDNRAKFLSRLPEAVTTLLPQQIMMMSIDAGASPIGLVMGFVADDQEVISNSEYMGFKNLCAVTSKSLATLRSNTRKRAADK